MEMACCGCNSRIPVNLGFKQNLRRTSAAIEGVSYCSGGNRRRRSQTSSGFRVCGIRASMVDSYETPSNFVKRMEQAWLISQQPRPISCTSCNSNGHVECQWCGGTGFFIIGDNMLCQVPSRNTSCVICSGKGSKCCSDCKGTGFRAKWLGEPPIHK